LTNSQLDPGLMAAVIDSANDAVVSKTLEGIITSWNKGAERIFGYKPDEIIGKPVLLLIPADLHSEEDVILSRIRAGERIEHYETIRRRKDGTLIDISLTVSPIKDSSGRIVGASKIARDVTDLKRAKAQLHVSQQQYQTLFNSIDDGFCVIQMLFDENKKPIDYLFLEANPAFEKHNGLSDAVGKTARELVPGLEDVWFETYGKIALTGEATRLEQGSDVMNRWFDLYAFPVGGADDGKVAILFTDISERKRADREREQLFDQLQAERAKLDYLFSKAPAFVATMHGPEHIFEMANPAYLQLIGHRDVIGKRVRDAIPEIEGQGFYELLDSVFYTGQPYTGKELPLEVQREPDGPREQRFVDFVYQPIFGTDGEVTGIFAHGIDITDQVRARHDAEAANRAKDEFLATLSHEIRTPLNAILGWSRMMSDGQLEPEVEEKALEAIQRNARVQAQLIDDILDVSRIISGKLKLDVRPIELFSVVEAAVDSVLPAAHAKEIRLQRTLDSGSSLISGDPDRLQQVVWNLLSNAIKFTPKGGRVQVRLERINSHIELIVTDTGTGIPAEVLPFIFDRFRQADQAITRKYGGLGLGLAIVRHLVEMHGGTVHVENIGENEGAIFTVRLPLISMRSTDLKSADDQGREHPTGGGNVPFDCPQELEGLHILVVEDEEDSRVLIATVLEHCGAKVTTASSVTEAYQALLEHRPDILLSDLGMPGEDGYSLIKRVRSLPPEQGGNTPAAALTAYARVEDRMKVLRAGFQIHLPKPVEPAELVAVVANLAGRHE